MKVRHIRVGKKSVLGINIPMHNAKLIAVIGSKGYIMCGYLNIKTSKKFGDCAAIIKGVNSIDELLKGKIVEISPVAKKSGIKIGMTGKKALKKIV
ncbi:YunC family protein [Elusimicrobiota bacterium]